MHVKNLFKYDLQVEWYLYQINVCISNKDYNLNIKFDEIPENVLFNCAKLAKENSKASDGLNVCIDYCLAKFVKKASGAKPGMDIVVSKWIGIEGTSIIAKEKEEELKLDANKLQNPEYVARYAREKYLYSKDGELILRIDD